MFPWPLIENVSLHLTGKRAWPNNDILSHVCTSAKGHFLNGYECLYLMWSLTALAERVCLVLQGHRHADIHFVLYILQQSLGKRGRQRKDRQDGRKSYEVSRGPTGNCSCHYWPKRDSTRSNDCVAKRVCVRQILAQCNHSVDIWASTQL